MSIKEHLPSRFLPFFSARFYLYFVFVLKLKSLIFTNFSGRVTFHVHTRPKDYFPQPQLARHWKKRLIEMEGVIMQGQAL